MINFISGLVVMLLVTVLFGKIRGFIFKRSKKILVDRYSSIKKESLKIAKETLPSQVKALELSELKGFNCSIGRTFRVRKDGTEVFTWKKFFTGFGGLLNPIGWAKDIVGILNVRKLTIYFIILSTIFAYGYFKGRGNTPIKVNLDYTKEFKMKLDGHYLIKPKNSQNLRIEDLKGNIVKNIRAKDFPLLTKKLKPIGFILEPIGVIGYGASADKKGFEGGAGVSFIKYWKWRLDTFLTNRGIYLGTSYQITDNSGLGIGAGKGFDASNRIIFYYKFKF
jgi:hypothetical protein